MSFMHNHQSCVILGHLNSVLKVGYICDCMLWWSFLWQKKNKASLPNLLLCSYFCLQFLSYFIADHHGPPKVNFWEDPLSPSKWKEEHVSVACLCFHCMMLLNCNVDWCQNFVWTCVVKFCHCSRLYPTLVVEIQWKSTTWKL